MREQATAREAHRMIEEGENAATTEDKYSKLTKQKQDLSRFREAGREKIKEGEKILEEVAENLASLYASAAARNEKLEDARSGGFMRTWTNTEGQSVEAAFIKLQGDQLTIQTPTGDNFVIPLDKLQLKDQKIAKIFDAGSNLDEEGFLKTVATGNDTQVQRFFDVGYVPSNEVYADALTLAVKNGKEGTSMLKYLISLKLGINAHNSAGLTALSTAVIAGAEDVVSILLRAGASPTTADNTPEQLNPLLWALHKGNAAIAQQLAQQLIQERVKLSENVEGLMMLAENNELKPIPLEMIVKLRAIDAGENISLEEEIAFKLKLFGLSPTIAGMERVMIDRNYRPLVVVYHNFEFYEHTLDRNREYISEIILIWEELDDKGNTGAAYSLALTELNGWYGRSNPRKAIDYLEKGAKKGHSPSMVLLGKIHEAGQHLEKNDYSTFDYYRKAAEIGDSSGMVQLGHCYEKGIYVEKDPKKAFIWYERAVEAGSPEGMAQLGRCLMEGIGTYQDQRSALDWYKKAAEARNLSAMYYLGEALLQGRGSRANNNQGVLWLERAADFGDPPAMQRLGQVYSDGTLQVDKKLAFQYFREAAENGQVESMFQTADRLAKGIGVQQNQTAAISWYEKAVDNGHVEATKELAVCYSNGQGVARDVNKAFTLFKDAAEQNNIEAIANLSVFYAKGLGTPVNEEESTRLSLKVVNSGNAKAKAILELLNI